MLESQLKKITQGRDSVPVVFISPDNIRYDKTIDGSVLKCLWNDISQDSNIPKMADIQGNRSNLYIDLFSLPSISEENENKIKIGKGWIVEGRPNSYKEIKAYTVSGVDPDNQLPALVIHLEQSELLL